MAFVASLLPGSGWPQLGQLFASTDTSLPQDGHFVSFNFGVSYRGVLLDLKSIAFKACRLLPLNTPILFSR